MAKVLIVYGTTEGQTAKVAQFVADVARGLGHDALVVHAGDENAERAAEERWDGVIVGASLHEGRHQRAVREWVRTQRDLLERVPSAFFQVSLASIVRDEEHERQAMECVERMTGDTGWAPARVGLFAGALKYTQYDWLKRQLMRMIAKQEGGDMDTSRDVEYTDWNEVRRWTEAFCAGLPARAPERTRERVEAPRT